MEGLLISSPKNQPWIRPIFGESRVDFFVLIKGGGKLPVSKNDRT